MREAPRHARPTISGPIYFATIFAKINRAQLAFPDEDSRARRGRAPALDAAKIAKAVPRVGRREGLTMRAVADALEVDMTTLYRHVGGVAALRQIGARLAAPTVTEWPSPEGETWQSWLAELARYYRGALRRNPDLIEFADSALDPDFQRLEHATRILVGFGFDPRAAGFAHGFVINQVVGYVHQEQREAELSAQGRSAVARYVQALASDRGDGRLATLRACARRSGLRARRRVRAVPSVRDRRDRRAARSARMIKTIALVRPHARLRTGRADRPGDGERALSASRASLPVSIRFGIGVVCFWIPPESPQSPFKDPIMMLSSLMLLGVGLHRVTAVSAHYRDVFALPASIRSLETAPKSSNLN